MKPKSKASPFRTQVNGLLQDFAKFLRKVDDGMGEDTDPAVREAVAAYIAELEKQSGETPKPATPPRV